MSGTFRLGHYRRSCDRCHDQKLRCKREPNAPTCLRCQRAKAKCTMSAPAPPRARLTPFSFSQHAQHGYHAQQASETAQDEHSVSVHNSHQMPLLDLSTGWDPRPLNFADLDFPVDPILQDAEVEWDSVIPATGTTRTDCSPDNAHASSIIFTPAETSGGLSATTSPSTGQTAVADGDMINMASDSTEANIHRDSSASSTNLSTIQQDGPDNTSRAIRQLSDLVVELYDFSQTIPPLSAWDQPANDAGVGHQELGLDHVLKLSQRFIVILNRLYPHEHALVGGLGLDNEPNGGDTFDYHDEDITVNTTQPATVPHPLSNSGPGPTIQSTPPLDQPCELLALSGYLRIVEIYHIILEHVSACAASRKRTKANWHIMSLPSLTVGTFTMESTSATQVLVLVTLIEVMMTRSRELIRSMVRARKGGEDADGGRKMFSVGEATLEGFRPKEEATLLLARRVRRFVAGFGHE